MDDSLLTTQQLAARLQVTPETIREWAKAGRIPEVRCSSRVRRFDLLEVLRTLKARSGDLANA